MGEYSNFGDIPMSELTHYGVKGMKWGVRKSEAVSAKDLDIRKKGVKVGADGSILIERGVNIQRLVRSSGKSLPMKDLTYASVLEYDNARYVKTIGGKGLFGGGRDQILSIETTRKITAPPLKEATKTVSDLMLRDPEFRKSNRSLFDEEIGKRDLRQIEADPTGKTAQAWYENANMRMTFDARLKPETAYLQKTLSSEIQKKGFNALRDENDFGSGLSKAPIIIFSPEKSLRVKSVTDITDEMRKESKAKVKAYKSLGKDWVERELYK